MVVLTVDISLGLVSTVMTTKTINESNSKRFPSKFWPIY